MFVPLVLMAASAAMAAYGKIQQGKVESANAKAASQAQVYNAQVNEQNSQQAGMVASSRELLQRGNQAQQLGQMRAGMAETGNIGVGSNAQLERQSEVNAELDALTTRYQGVLQSRGYKAEAGLDYYQSKVSRVNAGAARQAGYWGAATELVKGAASMYGASAGGAAASSGYG